LSFSDGTTYNGSVAKTITYSTVGAASSGHNHDSIYSKQNHTHNYAGSSSAGGAANTVAWNSGNSFNVGGWKADGKAYYNTSVSINSNNVLMGAAWNDYAEFRESDGKPGQVVCEDGNGKLIVTTKRL